MPWLRGARAALAAAACTLACACHAGVTRYCDAGAPLSAAQKDRLFRFGAIVRQELERSGASVALVSRSGLDLGRFAVRYSHAGLSLRDGPDTPWAVRQLYYACDEKQPRLFDQGLPAFVLGSAEPQIGYVSVLLLPPAAAAPVQAVAADNRQALRLLGPTYAANAYAFGTRYQNCNQWVIELLALAWGQLGAGPEPRARAQQWLARRGYAPTAFDVGSTPLMWLSRFIPYLQADDHPDEDLAQNRYRVSMPASIEGFVQDLWPAARRIEFCHDDRQVVVHRGPGRLADGCVAGAGDEVVPLD